MMFGMDIKSKAQAVEMKNLRNVKGKTESETEQREPIIETTENQHLKWFSHPIKMKDETDQICMGSKERKQRGRLNKTRDDKLQLQKPTVGLKSLITRVKHFEITWNLSIEKGLVFDQK